MEYDLKHILAKALRELNTPEDDINFIMSIICRDEHDEHLYKTPSNTDFLLEQHSPGLSKVFHEASEIAGIKWGNTYPNED